jgi:hypothetical protein
VAPVARARPMPARSGKTVGRQARSVRAMGVAPARPTVVAHAGPATPGAGRAWRTPARMGRRVAPMAATASAVPTASVRGRVAASAARAPVAQLMMIVRPSAALELRGAPRETARVTRRLPVPARATRIAIPSSGASVTAESAARQRDLLGSVTSMTRQSAAVVRAMALSARRRHRPFVPEEIRHGQP